MSAFANLTTLDEIETFIHNHTLSFIFISQQNCSVCHGLLPQVNQLLQKYPNIQSGHIDADQVKEVAQFFTVFTVPVLLLFVEGKEYIREARIVHLQRLEDKIKKIYINMADS